MEELYILGNGFDLYLELETRYEDYFNSRKLDENFFKKLENIYKKNYQYGKNNKGKKVLVIVDNIGLRTEIEELYSKYKIENLFYLYLSFLKKENLNWNEVESNIKKFIIYTNESLKKTVENILENAVMNKLYFYILVSKIIILKKIDEIKNENENKRNDEEKREFNYLDFMMEQLNLFEKDFGNYIGSLELKEENKNRLINIFRTTCRKKIINFNYSIFLQDLIDRYKDIAFSEIEIVRRIKSIESIVNIHGDFKNPIFGIDSHNTEEQFQNFTKRKEKEVEELKKFSSEKIITQFLGSLDNLERAIESSLESKDFDSLLKGIEMIVRNLKDIMSAEGVEEIKAEGAFDPVYHHAVGVEASEDKKEDEKK